MKIYIALGLLVAIFGYFVWPTFYKYENIEQNGHKEFIRINRLTGNVQNLTNYGWQDRFISRSATTEGNTPSLLPVNELSGIEVPKDIGKYDSLFHSFELYNGTAYVINTITLNFTVKNADGEVAFSKDFTFDCSDGAHPFKKSYFDCFEMFVLKDGQTTDSYSIVKATGYASK